MLKKMQPERVCEECGGLIRNRRADARKCIDCRRRDQQESSRRVKAKEKEEEFRNEVAELEKEMSKEVRLGVDFEFFHVDGEYVGIGASGIEDREKFPLIQDSEFSD